MLISRSRDHTVSATQVLWWAGGQEHPLAWGRGRRGGSQGCARSSSPTLPLQPSPLSRAPQGPLYRAPPSGGPRQGSGLPWGQPRRGLCPGAGPSPGAAEGAGGQGPLRAVTGAAGDGGLHPRPCPAPGLAGLGRGSPRSPGGLAWPLPACFLRLFTALPPLGSSRADRRTQRNPHPLTRAF